MNILFLMKGFGVGGQEVVTSVLADNFLKSKYNVSIVFLSKPSGFVYENLDFRIKKYVFEREELSLSRIKEIRKILVTDNIDVVINQWGLPFGPAFILKHAIGGMNIKIISVYHNQPNINARIKGVEMEEEKAESTIKRSLLKLKKAMFTFVTCLSMRYVYHNSDKYILLSNSHIDNFRKFTGLKKIDKIQVITNPITIDSHNFVYNETAKKKEIIYIGRIDYNQKRAFRLADVWSIVKEELPDWNFTVIGKGEDFEKFVHYINRLKLERIKLEGFAKPKDYYERASIMIMTSEYEGLPLVIAEGMSYGVVPIVYGSFSSVYDIIEDGRTGYIVPKNGHFDTVEFSQTIISLARNGARLHEMAQRAIIKSKDFNVEPIMEQWRKLIDGL